jgi:cyclophilin family peptidyl-prolyl cis-trans isomerase
MQKNKFKKVLLSISLCSALFLLSACTQVVDNTDKPVDNSVAPTSEIINDQGIPVSPVSEPKQITNKTKINNIMKPEQQADLTKTYSQAILKTSLGDITVKFYADESPITVNNFLNLAQAGFYDGVKFHRVIKDFMIQSGDPLSKGDNKNLWGTGGPDYRFADEFNDHKLVSGSLAMANAGASTNGSQFFIVTAQETPWLDGGHTNFGYVVDGMEVVKKIEAVQTEFPGIYDRPIEDIVINSIELVK